MAKNQNINLEDFINMLQLKCSLYYYTIDDFMELCKNEKQYATFLDSSLLLAEYDEGFLRLDSEFPETISQVIEEYRFTYTDSSYVPVVNDIICRLNAIDFGSQVETNAKKEHYLNGQEDVRDVVFVDSEEFISTVVDDYFVYEKFLSKYDEKLADITIYSSLNYFIGMCPDVFLDSNFYQNSMGYLEHQANRFLVRKGYKECILKTKDTIQKIKKGSN